MVVPSKSIKATVSIGAAVYPEDGQTEAELSEYADSAMYLDKKNRKDRMCDVNMELLTAG
jgi:GGDEF domain-containing protein